MPVERREISVSQLAELLGIDPSRFLGLESDPCFKDAERRQSSRWWIVLEPEMTQTSGTFPALAAGGKKVKGGKKKC